jgi:hypothetical protein
MEDSDRLRMEAFVSRWEKSGGNERANYQLFITEFCDALGIERPRAKGTTEGDRYCFDKDIKVIHPSGEFTPNFIDLYKEGHFVLEAKQGSDLSAKGTGKRGTNSYRKAMKKAFSQALNYARFVLPKPPFLITCDIGNHFQIWQDFSDSWLSANGNYGTYDSGKNINFSDLLKPEIFDYFVKIFNDPQSLNPEKIAAKVTREVAADLAKLAKTLEHEPASVYRTGSKPRKRDPQEVAQFLMRCIFTMFAEDVELLPEHLFTEALKDRWIPKPHKFKEEVEALWQAMNDGQKFGYEKLLHFNGNLFADPVAFKLTTDQLKMLLDAAERDWKNVEPAIFGTLLEQALEIKERSQLGAHYTPRSYVERLVRPTIIEPLQERWQLIQGEVEHILEDEAEINPEKMGQAQAILEDFLKALREIKVLDPACGSGNFLYVTLDLMKTLELEVFNRLETVTGVSQLKLEFEKVNPSQFLGIEINPRAAAIADLVIWIGYLQWHSRLFGNLPPIEPVLREYKNIECRDAVLAYDKIKTAIDPKTKKVRTRWGGATIKHPITGKDVPDPNDQIKILHYVRPRSAQWPEADYIVSNPPFIGNKQMREQLGDGYAETLRKVYKNVSETVDFVMYWWESAANLLAQNKIKRFGFITTNSIKQAFNKKVLEYHLKKSGISLHFVIPDHPWVDAKDGAAVRVALTSAIAEPQQVGTLQKVVQETIGEDGVAEILVETTNGLIYSDLTIGSDVASMQSLKANENMSFQGVIPLGKGFRLEKTDLERLKLDINNLPSVIKPYMIGRDLVQNFQEKWIIDFFRLTQQEAIEKYPNLFQIIVNKVKPSRDYNRDKFFRENWWLFGRSRGELRDGIKQLKRFIVTPDTSKFKPFVFIDASILPDVQLYSVVSDDAWILGVLESYIHQSWIMQVGPTLEDRLRWKPSIVFHPFPFPDPPEKLKQKIRELGERLDTHRKNIQAQHPDITLTGMYNLLEKMRNGESFTDSDREYNDRALVSILKQIHDELDIAVFQAYGWDELIPLWQGDEIQKEELKQTILEKLVALNLERAEEEKNGIIRWLRPEYQAPDQVTTQKEIEGIEVEEKTVVEPVESRKLPTKFKDQLAAIRELLRTQEREWTEAQIAAQFQSKTKTSVIANCLEILEELGLILCNQESEMKRYYAAEFQQKS